MRFVSFAAVFLSGLASAQAADICQAVALRDVASVENPDFILKKSEIDEAVTLLRIDSKLGPVFCSHGGYCYPTKIVDHGKTVDALKLTNCVVARTGRVDYEGQTEYLVTPGRADDLAERCTNEDDLVILKNMWIKRNVEVLEMYDAQRNPYALAVGPALTGQGVQPGGPLSGPAGPLILNSIQNDPSGQYKQCIVGMMTNRGERVVYYSFVQHGSKEYIESNLANDTLANVLAMAGLITDSDSQHR